MSNWDIFDGLLIGYASKKQAEAEDRLDELEDKMFDKDFEMIDTNSRIDNLEFRVEELEERLAAMEEKLNNLLWDKIRKELEQIMPQLKENLLGIEIVLLRLIHQGRFTMDEIRDLAPDARALLENGTLEDCMNNIELDTDKFTDPEGIQAAEEANRLIRMLRGAHMMLDYFVYLGRLSLDEKAAIEADVSSDAMPDITADNFSEELARLQEVLPFVPPPFPE